MARARSEARTRWRARDLRQGLLPRGLLRGRLGGGAAERRRHEIWQALYFKLNCKNVRGETREALTAVVRRRDLGLPQHARQHRFVLEPIPDAGWHFSYLGDAGAVRTKIEAYAHQELNRPEVTDLARLSDRIAAAQDPFDREGYEWRYVPLDASFPRHLLANPRRFARHLGAVPAVTS